MARWIAAAAMALVPWLSSTAVASETVPAAAAREARARQVLEQHCARCHQEGRLRRPAPAGAFAHVLDMGRLAREPHFVRPGNPDGSRLYTEMVRRSMPYDTYREAGPPGPGPDEIEAVRDWIAALERPTPQACPGRSPLSPRALEERIVQDRSGGGPGAGDGVRYLSLARLWNACAAPQAMEVARQAIAVLLNRLNRTDRPVRPEPVDRAGALLRIDLAGLGWQASDWESLAAASPYRQLDLGSGALSSQSLAPLLRADWLAFVASPIVRERLEAVRTARGAAAGAATVLISAGQGLAQLHMFDGAGFAARLRVAGLDPEPVLEGVPALEAISAHYGRNLSAAGVAAELGMDAAELKVALAAARPAAQELALRLEVDALPRAAFERLAGALAPGSGSAVVPGTEAFLGAATLAPVAVASGRLDLEILPDRNVYERSDVLRLRIRSTADCNLTLVSVDAEGRATVLLPNDWDQSVFLPAGREQRFPRDDAPFLLRLSRPGWETIVAGCNPLAADFDGIRHDFNLQKFTELGDYRAFLKRTLSGQTMSAPPTPPGERRVVRRAQRREAAADQTRPKLDPTARTAIRFQVR